MGNIENIFKNFHTGSIKRITLDLEDGRSVTNSQAGTESESTKDYVGRVAFEFFQNAVDRADENIWLELTKKKFIISNDGQPFSIFDGKDKNGKKSDFHSLNSIHDGSKVAGESIGNKGVGFKSSWNVSNHVIIESITKDKQHWGFELFNPVSVDNFDDDKVRNILKEVKKVPSFYFPKYIQSNQHDFKDSAVTKITINLNDGTYEEIKKELEEFKKTKFIFLNQLKNKKDKSFQIHLKIEEQEEIIHSRDTNWHIISLKDTNTDLFQELSEAREKESYENIPYEPNIAIAFSPDSFKDIETKFYTYLPTKKECGFNILIHADFALDNARKHIPENNYNNKILEIAAKIFVDELLVNTSLHNYQSFAKFLIPHDKNDKFAKLVWDAFSKQNILTKILQKVYTKDRHFQEKSYELVFRSIERWNKNKTDKKWGAHYENIYKTSLKYFCNENIYIVWIDTENKTFLPNIEINKSRLFYQQENTENVLLNFNLLSGIDTLRITNFDSIQDKDLFFHNKIMYKFSTLEILRVLKNEESINVIKFVKQLLDNTKEELSADVKKQLLDLKLPTPYGFKKVSQCYMNVDGSISSLFNDTFVEVDREQLKAIENLDTFLEKIGVANNRLPFDKELSFKENCIFPKSNDLKEFMSKSLEYLDDSMIDKLKHVKWFWDEQKNKLYTPNEVFLFKEHDNRKIESVAQEKKNGALMKLYFRFNINEIDDTEDSEKLILQLNKMQNKYIDINHQDIYKKITFQLAKKYKENDDLKIPILAIDIYTNDIKYIEIVDTNKVVFLETKYKKYKEQLRDAYDFIGYFDTNISHKFLEKISISVFNPNYTIQYKNENKEDITPDIDDNLKQNLQKEFLAPFFALASEVLGSGFEKDDAMKRWENLTIKKAYNVLLTIKDKNKIIIVSSTEKSDIDVLYIPIKDRHNKLTKIGEVSHDLNNPIEHQNLKKFAQVFAEGIFRNQKLKSDFELYIVYYLNKNTILQKGVLEDKGVDDSHIKQMELFIKENLLDADEKQEILMTLENKIGLKIDTYEQIREFKKYRNIDISFDDFKNKFDDKYQNIILNVVDEYKSFMKNKILQDIENKKQYLQVLCFIKYKNREEFTKKIENIQDSKYDSFKIETNIFELFDVDIIDNNNDSYINSMLDFENFTENVADKKMNLNVKSNPLKAKSKPSTGDATKSKQQDRLREEKNEKVGLGQELKLAYKFAKQINDKKSFILMIKKDIFSNDNDLKDNANLKKYLDNLDNFKEVDNLVYAKNVIQIASHKLDGLGYDLIIPSFDENHKVVGIKKVELKTTTRNNDIEIHFSKNELERILHYMGVDNWEIWLNNDKNPLTDKIVRPAINDFFNKTKDVKFYSTDYILKLGI